MTIATATAHVVGILRGREINADADVSLEARALVLAWQGAVTWQLAFDGLDGIASTATQLTLYLTNGDVLELSGDERLRAIAVQLPGAVCAMPEVTRGLRSLGSRRGAPGAAHDAWFAPLLAARRTVEGVTDARRQSALIDAGQLGRAMERAMSELAALTAPGDAARQRAIEAALEEESEGMFVALARMALAADALSGSASDSLFADWRRWVTALREVFVAADEAWGRCSRELAGS
jgi:hypothetical protein